MNMMSPPTALTPTPIETPACDVLAARSALTQRSTKEVVADLIAGGDGEAVAGRWYPETITAGELPEAPAGEVGDLVRGFKLV